MKVENSKFILPTLKSLCVFLIILFFICGIHNNSFSQGTGTITGTVTDADTGLPLPGVNVQLRHTVLGTSTSLEGEFSLSRIEAGSYSVMASMIGYKIQAVDNVAILPGSPAKLDFKLEMSFVEADAIVVTASRKAKSLSETPNSISIISAMDIRKRNSVDVRDALKYAPGVTFIGGQVNIRGTTGFSRGAGSRVLLLTDGVPTMPGDSGDIKWDIVPFTAVEKIEVVKGAASALYGSSAISGVINIITKEPAEGRELSIRSSQGIYDPASNWTDRRLLTTQGDIFYSESINDFGYVLAAGLRDSRGFKENSQFFRWNVFGKAKYKFTTSFNAIFTGSYAYDDHGQSIQWQQYLGQGVQPYLAPLGEEKNTTLSKKLFLNTTLNQLVNQKLALKFRASYFRNSFKNDFIDNQDFSKSQRFRAEYQADIEPSVYHSLIFGIEGTYDVVEGNFFGERMALMSGSYIQDEFKISDRLSGTAGIRIDISKIFSGNDESQVSPKFGLIFDAADRTTFRASLGKGFRAPSIAELFTSTSASGFKVIPNPDLKAESSWSGEIGFKTTIGRNILWDVALYQERYFDFINPSLGVDDTLALRIQFNNVQAARIRGIETNVASTWFGNHLNAVVTYIFVDPRDLNTGNLLSYRPQHLLTTSLTLKKGIFELGADYRFASRLKKEQLEIFPDDPRVATKILDARVGVVFRQTTLMLNAENLLQYKYNQVERNLEPARQFSISWQRDIKR